MNQTSSFQSTGYNHAQKTKILGTSIRKIQSYRLRNSE